MSTQNATSPEILHPGYASAAKSFEAEAQLSGLTSIVLSVVAEVQPTNPIMRRIFDKIEQDETLDTPTCMKKFFATIGDAAIAAESAHASQLKSAQDCSELAITHSENTDHNFSG